MRVRLLASLICLCGCNRIFGLEDTALIADADPCVLHAGDPGFHDEDGDGHDDACDNCPGIPNADQANALEAANGALVDQVGDACDPNPALSGDTIALFDAFADSRVAERWDLVAGGWSFDGESLVYVKAPNLYAGTAIDLLPEPAPPFTAEFHLTLDVDLPNDIFSSATILIDGVDDGTRTFHGVLCGVARSGSPPNLTDNVHADSPGGGGETPYPYPLTSQTGHRVAATYDPAAMVRCGVRPDANPSQRTEQRLTLATPPPPGHLGFAMSYKVDSHIHYVVIYGRE
ncbi:MAG TPA: hypothetical protein VLB44_17105 [Kofleriaceae bacterium]|nr:hypothetical protein [Kofleriaceae bacterium]